MAAVTEIEAAGYTVHHMFAEQASSRSRRKRRFWPHIPLDLDSRLTFGQL